MASIVKKDPSNSPKFVCIGAQKAGTTWLADALTLHPDLWNPGVKEIHFFDRVIPATNQLKKKAAQGLLAKLRQRSSRGPNRASEELLTRKECTFSLDDYLLLFENKPPEQIAWEITPSYASMPEANVEYMSQALKGCKYLFIIRDPYERAVSQWRMAISRQYEREAFNEAELNKEFDKWVEKDNLNRGKYSSIIDTYAKYVDLDKYFLFLPFGEIKARPQNFLKKIYNYIGISEYYPEEPSKPSHITKKHNLSDYVRDRLTQLTSKENIFLRDFFGEQFAKDCS